MSKEIKLNSIILNYHCPVLDKNISKTVKGFEMYVNSGGGRYDDEVDIDISCKCGKRHDINIK